RRQGGRARGGVQSAARPAGTRVGLLGEAPARRGGARRTDGRCSRDACKESQEVCREGEARQAVGRIDGARGGEARLCNTASLRGGRSPPKQSPAWRRL